MSNEAGTPDDDAEFEADGQAAAAAIATQPSDEVRALDRQNQELHRELDHARGKVRVLLGELAQTHVELLAARDAKKKEAPRGVVPKLGRLLNAAAGLGKRPWAHPRGAFRQLRATLREQQLGAALSASGLFDARFYLAEYGDVQRSGMDPLLHFVRHGAAEGRDPNPLFDTSYYLQTYPDVAKSGTNPLLHFLEFGWRERRRPHPAFDTGYYLDTNPDISNAGVNPLAHYLEFGGAEGRNPSNEFDARGYLARHPEAGAGGRNPLIYALRSQTFFAARTLDASASRHEESSTPSLERWRAEMNGQRRRCLVVDATLPTPDRDSGSITTLEIIKAVQGLGYAVTFIPFDLVHSARYAGALEEAGIWCLTAREIPSLDAFLRAHGALFDAVFLSRVTIACHLIEGARLHCPRAAVIFETMDLHYLREQREAELSGSPEQLAAARTTEAIELDLVRRCDLTLVHSTREREILAERVPEALVYHLPYVLDARGSGPGFTARRDFVFIGGFRHRPNVDAVLWFAREVLPLVRRELPDARLVIVGSDPTPEVKRLASKSIVVRGYVEELRPVLDACRLTVAPLRYGAGYKGKVAMSLAHGVPAALTSIAAEGMGLVHGEQVLIADQPEKLAQEIARLYTDRALWERLAASSLRFVAENFSSQAARLHLERVLRAAGAASWSEPDEEKKAKVLRRVEGTAIFPSRFMRELHRLEGVEFARTAQVPHGVVFRHDPNAARVRRDQLREPGVLRLLFASRVVEFKGLHTAIEALPQICEALPHLEVKLAVIGDTQDAAYQERLRALIDEKRVRGKISFAPPVPEEKLFELFQQHDVFLFPSLFEPFALTLIHSLEAGIPTVASIAGGNVDIVVDHQSGLLFPVGDSSALAARVVELAARPALRQLLAENGQRVASGYTAEAMLARIEGLLSEAAQAGRAP